MLKRLKIAGGSLIACESEDSPVQIYISPTPEERRILNSTFNIDEHTLSSSLDPDEIPRIEFDPDYTFLIWKYPLNYSGQDNFFFNVASIGFFIIKNKLIIITKDDISFPNQGSRQMHRMNSINDVLLTLLYGTIHHYFEHLKIIRLISGELQQKISKSLENRHLIQMFNLTESLVYYVNAIGGNYTVLTRLRNHAQRLNFMEDTIEVLDDIMIDNNQCLRQGEIYSEVLSNLMDARGTLINNNMNILLKKLTIINVVFLPLNLIASIGGMSEYGMITKGIGWGLAYSLFFIAMALIGGFTAFLLGRMSFAGNSSEDIKKKLKSLKKKAPMSPNEHQ